MSDIEQSNIDALKEENIEPINRLLEKNYRPFRLIGKHRASLESNANLSLFYCPLSDSNGDEQRTS